MQSLYSTSGIQVAFIDKDSIYYNSGKLLGVIKEDGNVYGSNGGYIGEIRKGLLLRKANMGQPKIPTLFVIPQNKPLNRVPVILQNKLLNRVQGIKRMKTLVPVGYISVLG